MTTIAYRDGVLAADTGLVGGGVMVGKKDKIARRSDGSMAGASGDATYCESFLKWFMGGERGKPPEGKSEDGGFDRAAIFRPGANVFEVFEPRGRFTCTGDYYAFGSGKEGALGAMFAGADAVTAIKAAIELDPHTSGPVTVMRSDKPKERSTSRKSKGARLYAVRTKDGKFTDIQTYKRRAR